MKRRLDPISRGFSAGPSACAQSESTRPSQKGQRAEVGIGGGGGEAGEAGHGLDVVALAFDGDTHSAEYIGYNAEVLIRYVLDGDIATRHSCHTDERTDFNHVGQHGVLCSMQLFHTFDGEQVRCDAADLRTHAVQHLAQLLNVGFAGSVVYLGRPFGQCCSHDDVGCTGHRCFVQEHVFALQMVGIDVVDATLLVVCELCTEFADTLEVGVESASAYLVTSRFCHTCLVVSCEQWTEQED
jgi:hypothetical protein